MLTDFVAVEYCNGPALACQAFRRHMENRGHHVGLIGPKPSKERKAEGETILLDSWRFRQYGNAPFAMPWPMKSYAEKPNYDIIHANSNSMLMHWAPMVRKLHGIPQTSLHRLSISLQMFLVCRQGLQSHDHEPGSSVSTTCSWFSNICRREYEHSFLRRQIPIRHRCCHLRQTPSTLCVG